MNAFITTVMINDLAADYKVFAIGKKFKAILMQAYLGNCLPCQVEFWKDKGNWKTHHPLSEAVINQFGNLIDGHLDAEKNLKNSTAA